MKPPLAMTPDEMRRAGYAVIDRLVEHYATMEEQSPWGAGEIPAPNPFDAPPPRAGASFDEIMTRLDREFFPYNVRVNHPRFYAFIPGPSTFVGVLADALAAGFNVFGGSWIGGSAAAEMERATIGWFRDALGFEQGADGLFTSGGSAANMIALAVARSRAPAGDMARARIYTSTETHSSVERGARILGFAPSQFRKVAVDDNFRIDMTALRSAVEEDRLAGLRPFCVVANAGTTNTGAIDPIGAVADLCAEAPMWLHVDGAYGACAAFSPRGREALKDVARADSISFDPHKWLFQPYEIGGVLVRDGAALHAAFDIDASYMRDTRGLARGVNFGERGIQLTRSARALKLWMTFQAFGADAIAAAIENGFAMAECAEARFASLPHWRILAPASMGIVAARYAPAGIEDEAADRLNARIAAIIRAEKTDMITTTVLAGRVALKLCPIHPCVTKASIEASVDRLNDAANQAMTELQPTR